MRSPLACIILAALLLSSCQVGETGDLAGQNDELRARILDLQTQLDDARLQFAELNHTIATLSAASQPASAPASPELAQATPRVSGISLASFNHAVDQDADGAADGLIIYVTPHDGLGRFIQLAGELTVHAALLAPDADAVTLGRITLSPKRVRESYRSTFLGTHYTVAVPITLPANLPAQCTVRAVYRDGHSTAEFSAESAVSLDVAAPAVSDAQATDAANPK